MEQYVWLFPLLFIFHDMEEIIGFGIWLQKNKEMLAKKYPFVWKTYRSFSTEGFSLAVFEEFIVCIAFSVLALYTNTEFFKLLWLGGFIACTLHYIIHVGQSIIVRQYIPALITSMICLPISILVILRCIAALECRVAEIAAFSFGGIVVVSLNLKFAQFLMGRFTEKKTVRSKV